MVNFISLYQNVDTWVMWSSISKGVCSRTSFQRWNIKSIHWKFWKRFQNLFQCFVAGTVNIQIRNLQADWLVISAASIYLYCVQSLSSLLILTSSLFNFKMALPPVLRYLSKVELMNGHYIILVSPYY